MGKPQSARAKGLLGGPPLLPPMLLRGKVEGILFYLVLKSAHAIFAERIDLLGSAAQGRRGSSRRRRRQPLFTYFSQPGVVPSPTSQSSFLLKTLWPGERGRSDAAALLPPQPSN